MAPKYTLVWKTLRVFSSLAIAWGLWYALIQIMIVSGVSPIQKMAVALSPWTYFGWLLYIALAYAIYSLVLSKLLPPKPQ